MIGKIINNYRVVEKLGEGGMGVVYKGIDTMLDRPVAIKMLAQDLTRDPKVMERFQGEAKTQAKLNHPNITALYGFFQYEQNYFMVMEYIDGESIGQMIQRMGPIPYEKAIPLFKQALLGIGYAHRLGVIHRDLKPSNIMVTRDGAVKVMDFGIAKILGGGRLTRTGTLVGTVLYMSPEQIRHESLDMRSDIYSLGITLYEMVTGRAPFDSESDFEVMQAHVQTPPPPPTKFYPYIPKKLEQMILKSVAKHPDARFQTVEEFSAGLDEVTKEPERAPEPVKRAEAEKPSLAGMKPLLQGKKPIIIALAAVLILAILGLALYLNRPKEERITLSQQTSGTKAPVSVSQNPTGQPTTQSSSAQLPADVSNLLTEAPKPEPSQTPAKTAAPEPKEKPSSPPPKVAKPEPVRKKAVQEQAQARIPSSAPKPTQTESAKSNSFDEIPSQVQANMEKTKQIADLRVKVLESYQKGHFTMPPNDCTVAYCQELLRVAPGDEVATTYLSRAVKAEEDRAEDNLRRGNAAYARQAYIRLSQLFPEQTGYAQKISQIESQAKSQAEASQGKQFQVVHDHNGALGSYCVGMLYISNDGLRFVTTNSTDGRVDNFNVPRGEIKEIKKNVWPIGGMSAFHIKLKGGGNYNFAHVQVTPYGVRDMGVDQIVMEANRR